MHQLARPGNEAAVEAGNGNRPKSMRANNNNSKEKPGNVNGVAKKNPLGGPKAAFGGPPAAVNSRLAPIQKQGPPLVSPNKEKPTNSAGSSSAAASGKPPKAGGVGGAGGAGGAAKGKVGFPQEKTNSNGRDGGGGGGVGGGLNGFAKLANMSKVKPIVVTYEEDNLSVRGSNNGELKGVSEYIRHNGNDDVISGDQLDRLLLQARTARGNEANHRR